jgi:hypothetical protein
MGHGPYHQLSGMMRSSRRRLYRAVPFRIGGQPLLRREPVTCDVSVYRPNEPAQLLAGRHGVTKTSANSPNLSPMPPDAPMMIATFSAPSAGLIQAPEKGKEGTLSLAANSASRQPLVRIDKFGPSLTSFQRMWIGTDA